MKELTRKIRELDHVGKLFMRQPHIEKERIYRGITVEHVGRALKNGEITAVRDFDSSVIWHGRDADGRLLELNCTLKDDSGEITVIVDEVETVTVGTAYEPLAGDDDELKAKWLRDHPDYEDAGKRKGVQKKLVVTRI